MLLEELELSPEAPDEPLDVPRPLALDELETEPSLAHPDEDAAPGIAVLFSASVSHSASDSDSVAFCGARNSRTGAAVRSYRLATLSETGMGAEATSGATAATVASRDTEKRMMMSD